MPYLSTTYPQLKSPILDRPSVLDASLDEDPWIKRCEANQRHVLYIQAQPIAMLSALPFDIVSLNIRLQDIRRRRPRESRVSLRFLCKGVLQASRQQLVDRCRYFGGFRLRFFERQPGA